MKKYLLIVIPLLWAALGNVHAQVLKLNAEQMRGLGVSTIQVNGDEGGVLKNFPARVEVPAGQMQLVVATLEGTLEAVPVAPGMPVRNGQTVARLVAPQALALQLAHAEASARDTQARAALKRDSQLFEEGIIPKSRLETTRMNARETAAQLASSRSALTLSGGAPGHMEPILEIHSRLDGIVLEQLATAGDHLAVGAPIVRIGRLSPLWLEIQAPQRIAIQVKTGDAIDVPALGVTGKIIAVGRALDAATQNVMLRAEITAGTQRLAPGQVVETDIHATAGAGRMVPDHALVRDGDKVFVFVATGDADASGFEARPVKLLGQIGDSFLVEGVKSGERIAVQGVAGLKSMLVGGGE